MAVASTLMRHAYLSLKTSMDRRLANMIPALEKATTTAAGMVRIALPLVSALLAEYDED